MPGFDLQTLQPTVTYTCTNFAWANVTVSNSDFSNNFMAIMNAPKDFFPCGAAVNAKHNYWGAPGGPSPYGIGSPVGHHYHGCVAAGLPALARIVVDVDVDDALLSSDLDGPYWSGPPYSPLVESLSKCPTGYLDIPPHLIEPPLPKLPGLG